MTKQHYYDFELDNLEDEQELDFNREPAPEGENYRFTDTLTLHEDAD